MAGAERAPGRPVSPDAPIVRSGTRPAMRLRLGETVSGKYRVEGVLGEGAVGLVLAARNIAIDELVALKVLKPEHLHQPNVVERFVREAKVASCLRSEHVAAIYDVGVLEDGTPFLVMEHLEGETLDRRIERGPLHKREAVDIMLQVCEGLAAAHALDIVHRDIKPENLFIARRPGTSTVKVLDFGLAKATAKGVDLLEPRPAPVGAFKVLGTPAYISPEQLREPSEVDERADVWSLGVTLFEMLTGASPFDADTVPGVCVRVAHGTAKVLSTVLRDASPALESVISRCLVQNREHRFANVAELAAALAPLASSGGRVAARRVERTLCAVGKLDTPTLSSTIPPPGSTPGDATLVPEMISNACAAILGQGALGVIVFDLSTERTVASFGSANALLGTAARYRQLIQMQRQLGALMGLGDLDEVVLDVGLKQYLLHPLVKTQPLCVCVLLERRSGVLPWAKKMLSLLDA